jgi:predicted transcriptional regulator
MSIEEVILETLSFYDPLTVTQIIMQTDMDKLKSHPQFTKENLSELLKQLEKKKLVKKGQSNEGDTWLRIMARRSLWQKLTSYF